MVVELSVSGTIEKGFPVNLVVPNWNLSKNKHQTSTYQKQQTGTD